MISIIDAVISVVMTNSIAIELVTKAEKVKVVENKLNIVKIMLDSTGVVWLVLLLLLFASFSSLYIIGMKYITLKKAKREDELFLNFFWENKALEDSYEKSKLYQFSPVAQVFKEGYEELERIKESGTPKAEDLDYLKRAIRKTITNQTNKLESLIPYLAIIGSTSPFVGLFGTVWGIMSSFLNIANQKSASLLTVAPGIAEALIATAIGLFAAIPAVIFYNLYSNRVGTHISNMENFENDFLNIVKRYIF